MAPGNQFAFHAVARDARGTQVQVAVHWAVADTGVASVDSAGVVTGKRTGATTLEARTTSLRDIATVRVVEGAPRVQSVTVVPATGSFVAGDRQPFVADARDSQGRFVPAPVSWSAAPASVVTVDSTGEVTCVAPGAAVVTATAEGVSGTAHVTVVAAPTVSTVAGSGDMGDLDGPVAAATFRNPMGVAVDSLGTIYVSDNGNHRIRVIENGQVRTRAGGAGGFADGRGTAAQFLSPSGIAVGPGRRLYVADQGNHCIRCVDAAGNVTTVAGQPTYPGYLDTVAQEAYFHSPVGVAVDGSGRIYVADRVNAVIRAIEPDRVVRTVCGTFATTGFADGIPGLMDDPVGVALGPDGSLYVCERGGTAVPGGSVVRRVGADGSLTTLAGNGLPGSLSGPVPYGEFDQPFGLAVGPDGWVYVADTGNRRVRSASPAGVVGAVAGQAQSGFLDGPGDASLWKYPAGITLLPSGDLLVTDMINQRVRRIHGTLHAAPVVWPQAAVRLLARPRFGARSLARAHAPVPDYSLPPGTLRARAHR